MSYNKVVKQNLEYFTKTLEEFKDEHYAVAQSKLSHMKRFEKMLELGNFENCRLLDVGCGIGGFYDYLKEKGVNCKYTGVDINEKMIKRARERNPEIADNLLVFDILEKKLDQNFDYVISVGPLNLEFESNLNMELTMALIQEMYRLAKKGCALSMTSSLTKKPTEGTFYYNPIELLKETFRFCTNARFDHTYLPHDFTLFCFKEDLYKK
jgi:SAM-dependent methyltransferase